MARPRKLTDEEKRERKRARVRAWKKANPENSRENCRKYYWKHKDKVSERVKKHRRDNPEHVKARDARIRSRIDQRAAGLRHRHGITLQDYSDMLDRQGGLCAICRSPDPGKSGGVFNVDHCHRTGKIRGLLCLKCNAGLGQFRDSVGALAAAIQYLQDHGAQ